MFSSLVSVLFSLASKVKDHVFLTTICGSFGISVSPFYLIIGPRDVRDGRINPSAKKIRASTLARVLWFGDEH